MLEWRFEGADVVQGQGDLMNLLSGIGLPLGSLTAMGEAEDSLL